MARRVALTALLALVLAAPAEARTCRPVSGYAVTATGVSCELARSAVARWARSGRQPGGWRCVNRRRRSLSCTRGSRQALGAWRR